jgi:hypothetical protein
MAKVKGKSVVLTALVAGAASFLSKKKNRDKAMKLFQTIQTKAGSFMGSQPQQKQNAAKSYNSLKEIAETGAGSTSTKIRENNFINEGGAQMALAYYNESDQEQVH